MIKIIKAEDRYFTDEGWLKTYWLFSFSTYYDPKNVSHGKLRVFNDDVVKGKMGFGTHPHEEMEIISIVLDGELTHEDSMGNKITIKKDEVQRITAGTGILHSERNLIDDPVHFYQIWIKPDKKMLEPSYDHKSFDPQTWQNRLAQIAGESLSDHAISLNTDASIFRSSLKKDKTVNHSTSKDRKPYIYVKEGSIDVNGTIVNKNDQARVSKMSELKITSLEDSEFFLIDVPS